MVARSIAKFHAEKNPRVPAPRRFALLVLIAVAGCANATDSRSMKIQQLQEQSQQIAVREDQCMDAAVKSAGDAISKLNKDDPSTKQQLQAMDAQRSHDLAECKAAADRDNQALSAREMAEYQHEADEQRARVLMLEVITAPSP